MGKVDRILLALVFFGWVVAFIFFHKYQMAQIEADEWERAYQECVREAKP